MTIPPIDMLATFSAHARNAIAEVLTTMGKVGPCEENGIELRFVTDYPGVVIPPRLKALYPNAMVIIIQHLFSGMEVRDNDFDVYLQFDGVQTMITIPFGAIFELRDVNSKFQMHLPVVSIAEADKPEVAAQEDASGNVVPLPRKGRPLGDNVVEIPFGKK
ncbi:ClpXP protease specificity-enhancing factor SspB [Thalassospira xianhensis]|uniref:Stringent starvation protein B n=1 Tax=Thalassospira xianhensis MCCC 1A02616 TaxID=1177929 RepID=A0A367UDI7_9PROT|nr:ClpXP protease specificity-enhancing factor SspB [Thalassospira xianhensis]RCK06387.1 hypothetical protein TH5_09350 [Thalassospira xianhensis MCCC 1A02616]